MVNQIHMNLDAEAAKRQRKAFEDCRQMIEEIPTYTVERLASLMKMSSYNARFAHEHGDRYTARQWCTLHSRLQEAYNEVTGNYFLHSRKDDEMEATKGTPKVQILNITIERLEGKIDECKTVTVTDWDSANCVLWIMSQTAPEHGGDDAVAFVITFENGKTYDGRYDLKHHTKETPDLKEHVRDFVRFSSGIDCPKHMTEESWREYLEAIEHYSPGTREAFTKLYHNYDIGF